MSKPQPNSQSQYQSTLEYYKQKVDDLYNERLAWLSKFDECNSKLTEKNSLRDRLKNHKNQQRELNKSLIHHNVAILDEKLNVIRMERDNLMNDFEDAAEVLKIDQLMEMYPEEIQKKLPCTSVNGKIGEGDLIQNDLNIHNDKKSRTNLRGESKQSKNKRKNGPTSFNIHNACSKPNQSSPYNSNNSQKSNKNKYHQLSQNSIKITPQELLQQQIIELKHNQQQQLSIMQEQANKLQDTIRDIKQRESANVNHDRQLIEKMNKDYKALEKKHKQLADEYFAGRREQKADNAKVKEQQVKLKQTNQNFEEKVNKEMKLYEKENKAKQTLIIKKSEDFMEDYRAKMRAKERNLQALKENYEKMQEVCITKVKKLERAVNKANARLSEADQRRSFLVDELRSQLHVLERRVQEQKVEKAQRDFKMKEKLERERQALEIAKEKEEQARLKLQRHHFIDTAYQTMKKTSKSKSRNKSAKRSYPEQQKKKTTHNPSSSKKNLKKNGNIYGPANEESEDDESMDMSDLENIRRQIGELESKINK